ncbi:MAG: type II toxin-antitoxin system RelE/ParE family toxin [Acidobacteriaceae bacterium]
MVEIRRYVTPAGKDVVGEWLAGLKDVRARAKIAVRIDRMALGNFGDCKPLGQGVYELQIDWGLDTGCTTPCSAAPAFCCCGGGDKRKQSADIERARTYLADYLERTATP